MKQTQAREISRGKEDACRVWPHAVYSISSLVPYESEEVQSNGVPTLSVDRYYRLYYHPEVVNLINRGEMCFSILHEVCHPLLNTSPGQNSCSDP